MGASAGLVALVLTPACSGPGQAAEVTRNQAAGSWISKEGARLTLWKDNRFESRGIGQAYATLRACETSSRSGTWGFYSDGNSGITDWKRDSGPVMGLVYDRGGADCSFDLDARLVKHEIVLCLTVDVDHECGAGVNFSRTSDGQLRSGLTLPDARPAPGAAAAGAVAAPSA